MLLINNLYKTAKVNTHTLDIINYNMSNRRDEYDNITHSGFNISSDYISPNYIYLNQGLSSGNYASDCAIFAWEVNLNGFTEEQLTQVYVNHLVKDLYPIEGFNYNNNSNYRNYFIVPHKVIYLISNINDILSNYRLSYSVYVGISKVNDLTERQTRIAEVKARLLCSYVPNTFKLRRES